MSAQEALEVARQALILALVMSAPMVIAALIVGLVVSIFQAATQLQENTLTLVPKILAVYLAIMIFGLWSGSQLLTFTGSLWRNFAAVAH